MKINKNLKGNTKIFSNFLNKNTKAINFESRKGVTGNMKYFPSFSKE
jgi:hypothetical protein